MVQDPSSDHCVPERKAEAAGNWGESEEDQRLKVSHGRRVRKEKPLSLGKGRTGRWNLQRKSAVVAAREEFTAERRLWVLGGE